MFHEIWLKHFLDCMLALVALINPISKIFIISTLSEKADFKQIRQVALRASLVAILILIFFSVAGNIILRNIFHVQIYAFKIAGGLVLLYRGFEALNKGVFFEFDENMKLADMSIVPLASPMIAGPATISASLSFPVKYGIFMTSIAIIAAVLINLIIMLYSGAISRVLTRHGFMGALIRITGLVVATIGIQMVLDGISDYRLL
ncbi:MAG TPA: MarC family protein [Syntrophorhabdaceae bacterium]|nr:MarC family protein [Syntrophorhabdaceae bacterium]